MKTHPSYRCGARLRTAVVLVATIWACYLATRSASVRRRLRPPRAQSWRRRDGDIAQRRSMTHSREQGAPHRRDLRSGDARRAREGGAHRRTDHVRRDTRPDHRAQDRRVGRAMFVNATGQPVSVGRRCSRSTRRCSSARRRSCCLPSASSATWRRGSADAQQSARDLFSARRRLAYWDIPASEIAEIERTGEVRTHADAALVGRRLCPREERRRGTEDHGRRRAVSRRRPERGVGRRRGVRAGSRHGARRSDGARGLPGAAGEHRMGRIAYI